MPRDAIVLKIQRELCHPKYARNFSGLSRNRPQALVGHVPTELFPRYAVGLGVIMAGKLRGNVLVPGTAEERGKDLKSQWIID